MVQPSTSAVLAEVGNERIRQDAIWGGPEHDDRHYEEDWHDYITEHSQKAITESSTGGRRKRLIEVAALAVAAVESLDRKATAEGGRE